MGRKSRYCVLVAGLGWLFAGAGPGYGSGFALYEAGARSSALAGAVVARADDLSALFFNPAGLVQLPKIQIMCGFTTFIPRAEIVTHLGPFATPNLWQSSASFAPHLFASYQVNERMWLGLGVNSPFGLGIQYNRQLARKHQHHQSLHPNLEPQSDHSGENNGLPFRRRGPGHHVF